MTFKNSMNMKKKMKSFIALTIIILSGIAVWSCNQDETEGSGQPLYRYSANEIATLHSMAEQYGIPNVKFITESEMELPSIKEMEEIFGTFAAMHQIGTFPMEIIDSTQNSVTYKTKPSTFKRLQKKAPEAGTSNTIDLSQYVSAVGTNLWLQLTVNVKEITFPYPKTEITISAYLETPSSNYSVTNTETSWQYAGPNNITVSYSAKVSYYRIIFHNNMVIKELIASDNVSVNTTTPI